MKHHISLLATVALAAFASAHVAHAQADPPNTLADVKTVIVIQQENRSFDHYYTDLGKPEYYGWQVNVMDVNKSIPTGLRSPKEIKPYYLEPGHKRVDPAHTFRVSWNNYNGGHCNRFRQAAMGYYKDTDIPFYFWLANNFAISDAYFSPALGPTHVNRSFMMAGTSYGQTGNFSYRTLARGGLKMVDGVMTKVPVVPKTIFDSMTEYGHSWGYYTDGKAFVNKLFGPQYRVGRVSEFDALLAQNALPKLVFLESELSATSEHPGPGKDRGLAWVEEQVKKIMASPAWPNVVIFLTYDMSGGWYDHVVPPEAVAPDDYLPIPNTAVHLKAGRSFARYGFRTPLIVVSRFAWHHHVDHKVADHTSVLKFIQTWLNLPPLSARNAAAYDLRDMFDLEWPVTAVQEQN